MKLLFIENRHKTYLYESIAQKLKALGHDIYFMIQNKDFAPANTFNNYFIEYPKGNFDFNKADHVEKVITSDRQLNHFNQKDTAYFYYYDAKIHDYLKHIKPDIVFGESTAFHELLAIENCKKLNILYLNPCTCRYPVGRFSFYKSDTLQPYSGSNEVLDATIALTIINQIVNRETAPNYMAPVTTPKNLVVKDQLKKTLTYYKGESYNTPNPVIKYKLEKQKKKNILKWDKNASNTIETSNAIKVLYPLQMQPEANIDVWGRPYRNQCELIKTISKALPKNVVLYVKPNPKSKYELDKDLIDFTQQANNVKTLHHSTKMDTILPNINLVITVTGTIAIECILSNKPVVTLIQTLNNTAKNCKYISNIETELPEIIATVSNNSFPKLNDQDKITFINTLNKTSYKGIISDPFSDPNCVNGQNLDDLILAFNHVINT
ncbi:capsular biosynthesis protein [Mesoflavibacter sp. SCSIO 43206]|uniref:capsular biosynthesis protein n=1 Tax=Mesoflavibacter sp. SCSIO 43206 TaxID=2779362 RepID=UPI001CA9143C|nr:capsular biosynthesis protein [Mesoflavibacter sp. SCSIO 43206]UAB76412.1 hypothetical protein INR78_05310 [Mesoflavibacter sp. SCSIO 43206]